mmetsp:Transcript_42306/g.89538  ORF Transcript_42306/g.89538 Transcript_42306/m.89538 type:complete len:219 (-) Transcript_42306:75-731(-)
MRIHMNRSVSQKIAKMHREQIRLDRGHGGNEGDLGGSTPEVHHAQRRVLVGGDGSTPCIDGQPPENPFLFPGQNTGSAHVLPVEGRGKDHLTYAPHNQMQGVVRQQPATPRGAKKQRHCVQIHRRIHPQQNLRHRIKQRLQGRPRLPLAAPCKRRQPRPHGEIRDLLRDTQMPTQNKGPLARIEYSLGPVEEVDAGTRGAGVDDDAVIVGVGVRDGED